ncbi:DUF6894 family protein [Methylorubrum extorquens]
MPRFYFDIHDDVMAMSDTEGEVWTSREAAGQRAAQILPEIALHNPPESGCGHLLALVRDEAERVVFTATLDIVGKKVDAPILLPVRRVGADKYGSTAA